MSTQLSLPLFPLNTVLFPDGPLSLKIFEPRYLDMVSRCLREDSPFGVCLIVEGREAGGEAQFCEIGTLAKITDWDSLEGGLLGITAIGQQRFRVIRRARQADQLNVGDIELLETEPALTVSGDEFGMSELLEKFLNDIGGPYENIPRRYDDAVWVGYRLAELLPMPLKQRQQLLEMSDATLRLRYLGELLESLKAQ